ncbi:MAG: ribbon-helix-helix domain-containing protein [Nitrospiraceae bacterium]
MAMATDTRTTVYLKRNVYRALKVKAASTGRTVSDLINAAVLEAMREDDIDRAAVAARRKDPSRPFEKVIEGLKCDGLL